MRRFARKVGAARRASRNAGAPDGLRGVGRTGGSGLRLVNLPKLAGKEVVKL